jgi:hypothetical protein
MPHAQVIELVVFTIVASLTTVAALFVAGHYMDKSRKAARQCDALYAALIHSEKRRDEAKKELEELQEILGVVSVAEIEPVNELPL